MSRLFGYVGNDPDRVACALHPARKLLVANPSASAEAPFDSWGIGFYQGEVLLQRRPKAPEGPIDFYDVARQLRTDTIVGHVRSGTVGKPKVENTHPFRFRSWLFAHHGTSPDFAERVQEPLLAAVPDFLRRNIRGQTDSEHFFHLVLAHAHEAGKLDDGQAAPFLLREAIRQALRQIEGWVGAEAWRAAECALALTNGRVLITTRHGRPVYYQRIQSITDCPVCREATPAAGRPAKRIDHEHLRAVTVVADVPEAPTEKGWHEVPDDSFVVVPHDLTVQVSAIHE